VLTVTTPGVAVAWTVDSGSCLVVVMVTSGSCVVNEIVTVVVGPGTLVEVVVVCGWTYREQASEITEETNPFNSARTVGALRGTRPGSSRPLLALPLKVYTVLVLCRISQSDCWARAQLQCAWI
jgi:hypothetical protein